MAQRKLCSIEGCGKPSRTRRLCVAHYTRHLRHGHPLAGGPVRNAKEWLQQAISFAGDECLVWPFNRDPGGRGQVTLGGKKHIVSRLLCEMTHGPAPTPQHEAAHSCGNGGKACSNPRHLRWATRVENEEDKILHGTRNPKLTEEDVRTIRSLTGRVRQIDLAMRYGVCQVHISRVQLGKACAWVK